MLDIQDGLTILVDKPYTWTSFDVVNKIRWNLKKKLGVKKGIKAVFSSELVIR
jgi:tRNA pseudouridine55 synthase